MLASALVLGLAAGVVTGGRIERLGQLHIKWWPLLVAALLVRLLIPFAMGWSFVLLAGSMLTVVVVAVLNRRIPGIGLAAVGASLNLAAIIANGGMPVEPSATRLGSAAQFDDGVHIAFRPTTGLGLLGDVIGIPPLGTFSFGDLLLAAGAFWIPFAGMRRR